MKKITILLSTLLLFHSLNAQWIKLTKVNGDYLDLVSFRNANSGMVTKAGTPSTTPQLTKDGGKTWQVAKIFDSDIVFFYKYIYFPSEYEGYVFSVGSQFKAYKTLDGGETWKVFGKSDGLPKDGLDLKYLKKFNENYYIGTYINSSFRTVIFRLSVDGKYTESIGTSGKSSLFFCDSLVGYSAGYSIIQKTNDGGNTWNALGTGVNEQFNSIYFTDAFHGVAVGTNATILHTSNGGITWKKISNSSGGFDYKDVVFTTPNIGYICGGQGTILKTTDGGLTWLPMQSGTFEHLNKLSFPDSTVGFCVGDNGTVLKLIEDPTIPQVTNISLPTYQLCAGNTYPLSYTVNKKYQIGNVFTAYLSNGVGEFVNGGTAIGSTASDTSGNIAISIPTNTARNFGYRIRIATNAPQGISPITEQFIEIQPSVKPSISISTPSAIVCEGTEITLSARLANGGSTPVVAWYQDKTLLAKQGSIKVNPKDQSQYWAVLKSNAVCASPDTAVSNTITMGVKTATKPTISLEGRVLSSSAANGNQWYMGTLPIANAIEPQYEAKETGIYKVQVDDGVCPVQFSNELEVIITGSDKVNGMLQNLVLYPNPTSGELNIGHARVYEWFTVYHITGQKVLETKATHQIDVSGFAEGLYLLEAKDSDGRRVVQKFEKR